MALSFSDLKKTRSKTLDTLTQELTKLATKQAFATEDDRFWYPDVDKAGNGYAVIRFLPSPKNEDIPFVRVWNHSFQGPTGSWYIENSLTTIGKPDPVSEYNTTLWNSGVESDKEIARKQKRRLTFISNVYIIKDSANPENEGKIKLFRYGKKIFDKINDVMNPKFEDEKSINPFDLWEGANFKLKIRNVEGFRNYDKSEFDAVSALFDSDEKMEEIWSKEYSLIEFIDEKHFKPYEELKSKLDRVLCLRAESSPAPMARPHTATPATPTVVEGKNSSPLDEEEGVDDSLEYFKNLAKE